MELQTDMWDTSGVSMDIYIYLYMYIQRYTGMMVGGRLELHGVKVGVSGLGHGISGFQV